MLVNALHNAYVLILFTPSGILSSDTNSLLRYIFAADTKGLE